MKRILLIFYLFYSIVANSQDDAFRYQNLFVNIHGNYGFLTPHHESIKYFVHQHVPGFQLETGFKTYGNKAWHRHHKFPDVGFGFAHSGLGNNQVYGKSNAVYSFIQTQINRNSAPLRMKQKFSFGLSYITEKYDLRRNPYNLAISSNVNVYLSYMLGLDVALSDKMSAFTAFNFTHVSNGKIKEPNKGLNTITGSLGMSYRFQNRERANESIPVEIQSFDVKRWAVFYSVGWKQVSRRVDGYFFATSLALDYAFYARPKTKMGIGLDFFYDSSVDEHKTFDYMELESKAEYFRSAVHFSYEFVVGRTSFIVQPGYYFFNPYNKYGYGVNRLGIRYRLTPRLAANVAIKAHLFAKADFIEWGLGYVF